MPILKHKAGLYCRSEDTYGTPGTYVAGDFIIVEDLTQTWPTEVHEPRQTKHEIGMRAHPRGRVAANWSFSTEMNYAVAPDTAPLWGRFLKACGFSEEINTTDKYIRYKPSSERPAESSCSLRVYHDNTIYTEMNGARGNVVFDFQAGQRAMLQFSFQGFVTTIKDGSAIGPVSFLYPPAVAIGVGLALGPIEPLTNAISIDMQNDVQLTDSMASNRDLGGYREVIIVGRNPIGAIFPEATTVAANDIWAAFMNSTPLQMLIQFNTDDPFAIQIEGSQTHIREFAMGDRNGVLTNEIPLTLAERVEAPVNGDNELIVTVLGPWSS